LLFLLFAFGSVAQAVASPDGKPPQSSPGVQDATASASHRPHDASSSQPIVQTSIVMRVMNPPIPVKGSDDRFHIVYELHVENVKGKPMVLARIEVLDAERNAVIGTLESADIEDRLIVREREHVPGTLDIAQWGIVYVHVIVDENAIPRRLTHRFTLNIDTSTSVETGARTRVRRPTRLVLDPPLHGNQYVAGDGCCDSTRHVRATLALNGRFFMAQRFAIDWEQLNADDRIFVGESQQLTNYVIYGKPVFAVADARVATVLNGLPDTPPGALPPNLPIEQAEGNRVILDLGDGRFALYAHLQPDSITVREGDRVRRGEILGRVGSSGNSSEPHLHFHITDGPSLTSNGLPYLHSRFTSSRRGISTEAFDAATATGVRLATEPVAGTAERTRVMPLDLWVVDFSD